MQKFLMTMMLVALALWLVAIPAQAVPTQQKIDEAIQKGLAWLATQQNPNGSWGSGDFSSLGATAAALLAFEDEGHFPGAGADYSANVEKGLDYVFSKAIVQTPLPVPTRSTLRHGYPISFRSRRMCPSSSTT